METYSTLPTSTQPAPTQVLTLQDDKPQRLLEQISKVGKETSEVGFARKVVDFTPIRQIAEVTARAGIGMIIVQHTTLLGIKGNIDTLNKEDIITLVLTRFSFLSLEELYKAFQLERYSALGVPTPHYNLINAPYISQVLQKYCQWLQQTRMTHQLPIHKEKPTEEKAPLSDEHFLNCVKEAREQYLKEGTLPFFSAWLFEGLQKRGYVEEFSPEEKALLKKRFCEERLRQHAYKYRFVFSTPQTQELSLKQEVALKYLFEKKTFLNNEGEKGKSE